MEGAVTVVVLVVIVVDVVVVVTDVDVDVVELDTSGVEVVVVSIAVVEVVVVSVAVVVEDAVTEIDVDVVEVKVVIVEAVAVPGVIFDFFVVPFLACNRRADGCCCQRSFVMTLIGCGLPNPRNPGLSLITVALPRNQELIVSQNGKVRSQRRVATASIFCVTLDTHLRALTL